MILPILMLFLIEFQTHNSQSTTIILIVFHRLRTKETLMLF